MSVGSGVPDSAAGAVVASAGAVVASDPITLGEAEPEPLDEHEAPANPIVIATISRIPWRRLLPKAENTTDPPSSVARTIELRPW
jgi:hypothetical protein